MTDIFCKIINKEIPSEFLYEDEQVIVIKDIAPSAPIHILIISKEHIEGAQFLEKQHQNLIGHMVLVAKQMAEKLGTQEGYKLIFNCGKKGGQIIPHLHLHLLGGFEE